MPSAENEEQAQGHSADEFGEAAPAGDGFRAAAVAAEFESGKREETAQAAWRHSLLRLVRMGCGMAILIAGVAMLALPGPGWVTIAIGLAVLSRDVAWADRLLQRVRKRLPSDSEGKLPRSTIITMVVITAAALADTAYLMIADVNLFFWRD